jgi:hypothetical protein
MKNISVHTASDYAGLGTKNFDFYYGYEVEDEDGNWCFTASEQENGREIVRWSSIELGVEGEYPEVALLYGIGRFIEEKLF